MLRVVGVALCALAFAWALSCGVSCGGDRASVASKAPADAVATGAASGEEAATTEAATTEAAPRSSARRDPALEAVQGMPARAADEVRAAIERSRGDTDTTVGAPEPEAQ